MTGRRTEKVEIRVSEEEKQKIRKLAQKHGLGMASYGRMKMLSNHEVEA